MRRTPAPARPWLLSTRYRHDDGPMQRVGSESAAGRGRITPSSEDARRRGGAIAGDARMEIGGLYRGLVFLAIFGSGAAALMLQIAWQRALAQLVGAEARSISLVVAIFLLGLAAGYRGFGNRTAMITGRRSLFRLAGAAEIGIAFWGLLFPVLLEGARALLLQLPDLLLSDALLTVLLVGPPTFLMGATIPVLTAALPDRADQVADAHARIYGVNTVGACAGALLGGLWLVHALGISGTIRLAAIVDCLVGILLLLAPVHGPAQPVDEPPVPDHPFGTRPLMAMVFISGALSIAFEMIAFRLTALAIGGAYMVFPMVLGIVVLGLGAGSLSLRRWPADARTPARAPVVLGALLLVVVVTAPHWPWWISHIRVSLVTIPSNEAVMLGLLHVFFGVMLLPSVFVMGRLLPAGYALLRKSRLDYGVVCGRLYFLNTIGTLVGAVGLGYLALHLFPIEWILRLLTATAALTGAWFAWRLRWRPMLAAAGATLLVVLLIPGWSPGFRALGVYRVRAASESHFRSPVQPPLEGVTVSFVVDDPNATVAVVRDEVPAADGVRSWRGGSVTVNGKSEGHTIHDYSNMVLSGIVPYLHAPTRSEGLSALVIGLGTGLTTAALADAAEVRGVTTIEITPAVIAAARQLSDVAPTRFEREGSGIIVQDAFRFLARTRETFDIIVSEPSNPWVTGNDTLFTPEFYARVTRALADDGVLWQWIQLYETDADVIAAIVRNVTEAFAHVRLFMIGSADVGILASARPIERTATGRRLAEAPMAALLRPLAVEAPGHIMLLEVMDEAALAAVAIGAPQTPHTLDTPWLSRAASRARFLGTTAALDALIPAEIARHLPADPARAANAGGPLRRGDLDPECDPRRRGHGAGLLCTLVSRLHERFGLLEVEPRVARAVEMLDAYADLRGAGLIEALPDLLRAIERAIIADEAAAPIDRRDAAESLVREWARERAPAQAREVIDRLRQARAMTEGEAARLRAQVVQIAALQDAWFAAWHRLSAGRVPAG